MDALIGRWCPHCQTLKADFAFYSSRQTYCKACCRAKVLDYNRRNKAKVQAANRRNWEALKADPVAMTAYNEKKSARRKTPEQRAKAAEYQRKYYHDRKLSNQASANTANAERN